MNIGLLFLIYGELFATQLGFRLFMTVVPGCVQCQTEQALKNMKAVLESQGLTFADVVKTTVFIKDMNEFGKVNETYAKYFTENAPARSCVEVARLPKDVLVEIEAIALLK